MNDNWKKYFHIECGASTEQILKLLDNVQKEKKDEIDELINDSNMDFLAPEEIELTGNPYIASVLTPEAIVHIVDKVITHFLELEANKKKPEENTWSHGTTMFLYI